MRRALSTFIGERRLACTHPVSSTPLSFALAAACTRSQLDVVAGGAARGAILQPAAHAVGDVAAAQWPGESHGRWREARRVGAAAGFAPPCRSHAHSCAAPVRHRNHFAPAGVAHVVDRCRLDDRPARWPPVGAAAGPARCCAKSGDTAPPSRLCSVPCASVSFPAATTGSPTRRPSCCATAAAHATGTSSSSPAPPPLSRCVCATDQTRARPAPASHERVAPHARTYAREE
jgi:hypothetical protein